MNVEVRDVEQYLLKILQPDKEDINGTGFFCHPAGYILTCYHVIEPHLNARINEVNVIYESEKHRTQIYKDYCIKEADIAVLKLIEPLQSLKYLPLDVHNLWDIDDKIYSLGYPVGYFEKPGIPINGSVGGPTIIEDISVIQISGLNLSNVDHGYSGAPAINLKNKKVIGLIYARYQPAQAFFVPLTELLKRWRELRDFHDVLKKIRLKIAQKAQEELNKKLRDSKFIPLNLECGTIPREPEEMEQARGWVHGRKWEDFELETLLSSQKSFILSSSVGTGKTIFFHWLITQLIDAETVPIFMPCAEFERINPRNWNEFKEQLISDFNQDFLKIDIEYFLDTSFRSKKILFLFDGLDQIKGVDYSNLAKNIFKIAFLNRVIISSRSSSVISLESERDLLFLRLRPFSAEDETLYFANDYEKARSISMFAPDLIRIPMLAYMVKTLIREGKAINIFNRADIYTRFLDHIVYHHDPNIPLSSERVQLTENIKNALKRISFDALNLEEPQIQKISISLYSQRDFGIPVDELARFGLVNLVLERGDVIQHSLFFTHQSFQEFLAAQYINEDKDWIEGVINEKWSPKWKEVIKFLAGIRGQEIVEKIYSKDKKDNIIYSHLFLAAECLAEVRDVRGGIKEEINRKVRELIKIEPFRFDAISALRFLGEITSLKLLLRDSDSSVREAAVEALATLKDRVTDEVIKEIADRLWEYDWNVRKAAVKALAALKDRVTDEVVKEIAGRLQHDNYLVRSAVVEVLATLKEKVTDEMVKEIAGRLRDDDWKVRRAAADALTALKEKVTDEVVKEIAGWLQDDNESVREAAMEALAGLEDRATHEVVEMMEMAGTFFEDRVTDEVVKEMAGRLRDDDEEVRRDAVNALAGLKDRVTDEMIKEIAGRLRDDNWKVRRAAVEALAGLKDRVIDEMVKEIAGRLQDDDGGVRWTAVRALAKLKDRVTDEMVKEIAGRLRDEDVNVRRDAVRALAKLKDRVTDEMVKEIAHRLRDDDILVRRTYAIEALAVLKDRVTDEVVKEIAGWLQDDNGFVREAAVEALAVLKEKVTDGMVKEIVGRLRDTKEFVRGAAMRTLAALKDRVTDEVVKEIVDRLRDDDLLVRRAAAVEALAAFMDRVTDEAVKEIAGWLRDDDVVRRAAAVEALAELKDRVTDEVVEEIAGRLRDDNGHVRAGTYRTLKIFYESGIPLPLEKNFVNNSNL